MTNAITNTVANKLFKFGADSLRKAEYKALTFYLKEIKYIIFLK
jgi:hypothetical protein